jgi:polyisoprenoid-binding protein YceI
MAWQIDPSHTRAVFSVRHMMITNVRGQFDKVTGTVDFNEADPARSTVDVQLTRPASPPDEARRPPAVRRLLGRGHYPTLTFKGTQAVKIDDNTGKLTGDLTIRGITHPVTLDVEYNGQQKTPWGTTNAGFSATKINRRIGI